MSTQTNESSTPIRVCGAMTDAAQRMLPPKALDFLLELERNFGEERRRLLGLREERQRLYHDGDLPDFAPETRAIREGEWKVAPIPPDLLDRRVEITGPPDRKMVVNALNSGADVFMADFEDSLAPFWNNLLEGQIALNDYWRGKLDFTDPASNKRYAVGANPAKLMARTRGWHLEEAHIKVDGKAMSASLFDFGLYLFHNHALMAQRGRPCFYLPKLESGAEAALWCEVIRYAEARLGMVSGTTRVTVLIETLPAAFAMDEILHALRDYIVGLNCGRWDYIFSYIKRLGRNARFLLPDRDAVVMGDAFLKAYAEALIKTCHRRGALALGGMAAQIPVKDDEAANAQAFAKVRADKVRELKAGHDGTWVAHPALVPVAREVFANIEGGGTNQLGVTRDDVTLNQGALLRPHKGARTREGAQANARVGIQYMAAWLGGRGAVPLANLMEDAATAEICRAQLWQWIGSPLEDGGTFDAEVARALCRDQAERLRESLADAWTPNHDLAHKLFADLVCADTCAEFLTLPAYAHIVRLAKNG